MHFVKYYFCIFLIIYKILFRIPYKTLAGEAVANIKISNITVCKNNFVNRIQSATKVCDR